MAEPKDDRRSVGTAAERMAARHLERAGFQIVEANWRCAIGELDLVALDGRTVVFVEVKSSRGRGHGAPEEMVTARKQRRLTLLARRYLQARRWQGRPARFDVVAVDWDAAGEAHLRHLRGAFAASAW